MGYLLQVSTDGITGWITVDPKDLDEDSTTTGDTITDDAADSPYVHEDLPDGAVRYYRIAVVNQYGVGLWSGVARGETAGAPPVGMIARTWTAPTGLVAMADGPNAIDITWIAPADIDPSEVTDSRDPTLSATRSKSLRTTTLSQSPTKTWTTLMQNTGSTTTSFKHTGLAPNTTRTYRVSAVNSGDTGQASTPTARATTTPPDATKGLPKAPAGLTAAKGTDGAADENYTVIDLGWTASGIEAGDDPVSGYRIEYSMTGEPNTWMDLVANTGKTDVTYRDEDLAAGTTRHYRVSGINAKGTGPHSNAATTSTDAAVLAEPPTAVNATANGASQIDVRWTAPPNPGGAPITGYRIEVSPDGEADTFTILENNTGNTDTTYEHTGLQPETTRFYRVYAWNSAGLGRASLLELGSCQDCCLGDDGGDG